jgi:hypothetical protein
LSLGEDGERGMEQDLEDGESEGKGTRESRASREGKLRAQRVVYAVSSFLDALFPSYETRSNVSENID